MSGVEDCRGVFWQIRQRASSHHALGLGLEIEAGHDPEIISATSECLVKFGVGSLVDIDDGSNGGDELGHKSSIR